MNNNTSTKNNSASNFPNSIAIINSVLNAPLMPISIIGNALVISAILKTPSLRSPSTTLLCSLAVSDLLVGLMVQPLYITKEVTKVHVFPAFHISEIMQFTLCGVSLCTITAISLDRFAALHYHMRYATMVTIPRVLYTLVIIWLNVSLLSGFYFWNKDIFFSGISVAICVCLFISSFSYCRIFKIVQQH